MVFSSTVFLFAFLPIALMGYFVIRKELRNAFLLLMSLGFYAWGEPKFVFVMMASILINYFMGLLINLTRQNTVLVKRLTLIVATGLNLVILFYYKYFDFFITNTNKIFGSDFSLRHIALPIGISFFTFQGMSYIFDLYLRKVEVQKNLINIALYIALFPQLIAGPIVRYIDVNEQINHRAHTLVKFSEGIQRFIIGLSKKIIISNAFAAIADACYASDIKRSVLLAWVGALSYTIQIYFDFSGYSDMAIGLGKMFGFDFLENFDYPYISTNITEFWRRWHISLSSWFRDYVYIPLGGNRKGNVYFNLLVVFFITGMWHGASWNFIVWGLWHGFFLILERIFKQKFIAIKIPKALKWFYTMMVVIIGWVLFRAPNLSEALFYLRDMFGMNHNAFSEPFSLLLCKDAFVLFAISCLCAVPSVAFAKKMCEKNAIMQRLQSVVEPIVYLLLLIISISFTVISAYNPFIYFNF